MFKRDMTLFIVDIFIACDKCNRYIKDFKNAEELKWDELYWDASIRELEIIGEATNKLIGFGILENTNYRKIVDFRNLIVHGYFGIDEDEVYIVLKEKLPIYLNDLKNIVKNNNIDIKDALYFAKEENFKNTNLIKCIEQLIVEFRSDK